MNNYSILTTQNLTIGYQSGKQKLPVMENLSVDLKRGQLVCLIGPNGVGKSTLLRTLAGLQPALAGSVCLNGKELNQYSADEKARLISMVLTDKVQVGNMQVRDLVSMGRYPHTGWSGRLSAHDLEKVEEAISRTHIDYIAVKKLYELSDGQLQKAMIARALAQEGEIVMLDEPTAHLDVANALDIVRLLKNLVRETNRTMLISTHSLEMALEMADELWLAQCGSPIISGMPEDLVLSGKIGKLYPQEGIYFDQLQGKFTLESEVITYPINGSEPYKTWTERALKRTGLKLTTEVKITEEAGKVNWKMLDKQFDSLSALINFLKNETR